MTREPQRKPSSQRRHKFITLHQPAIYCDSSQNIIAKLNPFPLIDFKGMLSILELDKKYLALAVQH